MIMLKRNSPFKLSTHFRGWTRALALSLGASLALNFALVYAHVKVASNLSTPRIVMQAPSGLILPVAASAFVWTPEVARDYVKLFLPCLYTFTPLGASPIETWSPFVDVQLLKLAEERFKKNQFRIETDGLSQTLLVREAVYDPENENAKVLAELRIINKAGEITRNSLHLTVELTTVADPLNPYGHEITNVR